MLANGVSSNLADHNKTKSYGADVLRGVAILMVIIYHSFGPVYGFFLPWVGWFRDFDSAPSKVILWLYPITFGWAGVALFFVLSGFCIHFSFLRGKHFDLPWFFWRRFWRIYPAYIVALITFTLLNHIDFFSYDGAKQFFSHMLLLQNLRASTFFGVNASFWSIAVEFQLYLLFPVLLLLRSRVGITRCLFVTFAVGMVWRGVAVYLWGLPDHLITPALTCPFMAWFDWTLGAFVAERFFCGGQAFSRKLIWLFILIPLFVVSTLFKPFTIFSFSLAAAVAAIVLDGALQVQWQKNGWAMIFAFIGAVSYSLYLWHQPLLFRVSSHVQYLTGSLAATWLILIICMSAGSWISYRFFELIGIKVGDFLWSELFIARVNKFAD